MADTLWSHPGGKPQPRGDSNQRIPIQSSYFLDEVSAGIYVIGLLGNHRGLRLLQPSCSGRMPRMDLLFSSTFPDVKISLSTTSKTPSTPQSNTSQPTWERTTRFLCTMVRCRCPVAFSGLRWARKTFDIVINLLTPFLYDPSAGDLLLDVTNFEVRGKTRNSMRCRPAITHVNPCMGIRFGCG